MVPPVWVMVAEKRVDQPMRSVPATSIWALSAMFMIGEYIMPPMSWGTVMLALSRIFITEVGKYPINAPDGETFGFPASVTETFPPMFVSPSHA